MPTQTASRARVKNAAAEQGREVVNQAADEARDVASSATERGKALAETAKHEARQLTGTVRERAGEVTGEVSSEARSLADETRWQLEGQAREGTQRVAAAFRDLGGQAQALAEGRPEDAPAMADTVWRIADACYGASDRLYNLADDVEERGLSGVLEDVQNFARRRPGAFLLGAAVLGFGVGRYVKAEAAMRQERQQAEARQAPAQAQRRQPARTRPAVRSSARPAAIGTGRTAR
jgi:uncharacterized protein YjbJ (UPF0337 family)